MVKFNNDRSQFNGIIRGDKVELGSNHENPKLTGKVVRYATFNNTNVQVQLANGDLIDCVAEKCKLITKN